MDRLRWLRLLPLAALLLAGCRNDPFTVQYIEEVNNQNRQLEDVIYEQDYQLNVLKQELEALKNRADYLGTERRRPAPRKPLDTKQPPAMEPDGLAPPLIEMMPADVPPPVPAPKLDPPPRRPTPREQPVDPPANPLPLDEPPARPPKTDLQPPAEPDPSVPLPRIPAVDPTSLPKIEAEAPPAPPAAETLPPPLAGPSREPALETRLDPPAISPTIPAATGDEPPPPPAEITPLAKATSIFLHPLYTGGEDTDGRPGDEGLAILIEPRTDAGEFVPAVGKVSLALLDPARQGAEARVARWDFDADYVRRRMKTLTTQRGILLHTVWPEGPPKNNRLKLFVRLETDAGEKFEATREIFVALPGQLSNRWTPRTANGEAEVARQPGAATIGDRITGELAPEQKLPSQLAPLPEPNPVPEVKVEVKPEPQPEIPTRKDRPKKGLIVPPAALGEP